METETNRTVLKLHMRGRGGGGDWQVSLDRPVCSLLRSSTTFHCCCAVVNVMDLLHELRPFVLSNITLESALKPTAASTRWRYLCADPELLKGLVEVSVKKVLHPE